MQNTEYEELTQKQTRPGKKIKINNRLIDNKKISVDIGTVDNKNCPKTIYLNISFWVDIKNREEKENDINFDKNISKEFSKCLKQIYKKDLYDYLIDNKYFPFYYENIYSFDFPENLNYNNKKSFVSIEIHFHTINNNINSKNFSDYYTLKNDLKNDFFYELITIANIIGNSDLLRENENFYISKKK